MKKTLKKALSVLLVCAMLLSVQMLAPITVGAAEADVESVGAKTQAEAISWLKNNADNNKALDYDGYPSGQPYQCVDLIAYYLKYLDMTSLIGGNAKDYINKTMPSGSGWTKYKYSSDFVPKPGDICVWGAYATLDSSGYWKASEYGHIGVVYSVSTTTFTAVEQNVNGKHYCQYTYNRAISKVNTFIRPNFSGADSYQDLGTKFYANIVSTAKTSLAVSANDKANVYMNTADYSDYQKWLFEKQSDKSYKITNVKLGKCLDVNGGKTANGTNVQVYNSNDGNSQRWYIIKNGSGYSLIPKNNTSAALDISDGKLESGKNIWEWERNTTDAQRFSINKTVDHKDLGKSFNAYLISTKSGFVATVNDSTNVYITAANYTDSQKWMFEQQSDKSYKITNLKLNKCLDVADGKTDNGTNIQVYNSNNSNAQRWYIVTNGAGYSLVPKCNINAAMDIDGAKFAIGTNIQEWSSKLNDAQRFNITKFVDPTSIQLSDTSIEMNVGEEHSLTAVISPNNTTDKTITWTSSNTSVATVSNGKVTAKAAGTSTITAKTANGKTTNCVVTVKTKEIAPTSVELSESGIGIDVGWEYQLTAVIYPENATDKKIIWASEDESIATVSNGIVTGKSVGTTTVTASTSNGMLTSCTVSVFEPVIEATDVTLSTDWVELNVGEETTLSAVVTPSNAYDKTVIWESNDTTIATVSNGRITAKSVGIATVFASTSNGKIAACQVIVKQPLRVGASAASSAVTVGDTLKITANASGGSGGYTYSYLTYNATTKKWERLTASFGSSNVYTWKPTAAGSYQFYAEVKDSTGKTVRSAAVSVQVTAKQSNLATPKITSAVSVYGGVKINWNSVAGAAKYRVFYKSASGWKRLGDTTATTITDTVVTSGKSYTYTVRCLSADSKSYTSSYDAAGITVTYVASPVVSKIENVTNGVKITWNKVAGAAKYRVFYKSASGWKKLGDTTSTTITDTVVSSGKSYIYTVRCMNSSGSYVSGYYANGWKHTYIASPVISSLKSTGKGVNITWGKVAGAAKYRVFVKNGSSWTKLGDTTSNTFTHTSAKSGTSYTYTVRCLSADGKSYTSGYYSGKTIKA